MERGDTLADAVHVSPIDPDAAVAPRDQEVVGQHEVGVDDDRDPAEAERLVEADRRVAVAARREHVVAVDDVLEEVAPGRSHASESGVSHALPLPDSRRRKLVCTSLCASNESTARARTKRSSSWRPCIRHTARRAPPAILRAFAAGVAALGFAEDGAAERDDGLRLLAADANVSVEEVVVESRQRELGRRPAGAMERAAQDDRVRHGKLADRVGVVEEEDREPCRPPARGPRTPAPVRRRRRP